MFKLKQLTILALAIVSGEGAISNAQDVFTVERIVDVRCDDPEPIRSYAEGYAIAKASHRILLVFVTTNPCEPCRTAKRLLETMRVERSLGDCVLVEIDASEIEARQLMIGRKYAPQLIAVDLDAVGKINEPSQYALTKIDRNTIGQLLVQLPTQCTDAIQLGEFAETFDAPIVDGSFGAITVTYDISTEYKNGAYNGTFAWGDIQYFLDGHKRFGVTYRRVTSGGQWHIRQSNKDLGKDVAARHGGGITRISPTFRFVNATQSGMVLWHENRHHVSANHVGSGLMGPAGGYQILATDLPYFSRMPIKPTLDDPSWLKRYLSRNAVAGDELTNFPLMNQQREMR